MRKLILFALCLATPTTLAAEPIGRWWSGWGMGVSEYGYKADSGGNDSIYIACSPDSGTSVSFTITGESPDPESEVTVVIDGEEIRLFADKDGQIPTDSRAADGNFRYLWEMIRKGRTMRVRLSTGESTRFPLIGSTKALGAEPCETDFAR